MTASISLSNTKALSRKVSRTFRIARPLRGVPVMENQRRRSRVPERLSRPDLRNDVVVKSKVRLSAPSTGVITLGLQSYTNACAVITVTNRSSIQFEYGLMVERKLEDGFPTKWPIGIPFHEHGTLLPGITTLTVPVMVYVPPSPLRISIYCPPPAASAPIKLNPITKTAGRVFLKLRMTNLALRAWTWGLPRRDEGIRVSTAEVEQWEQ
jgi:hypothetical protein